MSRDLIANREKQRERDAARAVERVAEKRRLGCKCPRAHRIECPLYVPRTKAQTKAPAPMVAPPPPQPKPDAVRLAEAMGRAQLGQNATDRAAGVAKGTARLVLRGACALAKAVGGELLAWVVSQEKVVGAQEKSCAR